MNMPSQIERVTFWNHAYARSSFVQTSIFSQRMLNNGLAEHAPERDLFTIAILGAYCRPFKQRKPVRLDVEVVPEMYRDLHDSLEEMRDKVIAHRDLDGPVTDWGFVSDLHIATDCKGMEIHTISPRISDQKASDMLPLLSQLISEMDRAIHEFVKKHMPLLPLVPARYVVSLEENPAQWITQK